MKKAINKILNSYGIQIKRYPSNDLVRRRQLINYYKIDTLFDVGANKGQYAKGMRELGYCGKIISFEPLSTAFNNLRAHSAGDRAWLINNYALGNENIKSYINISDNSFSSSILDILSVHIDNAPKSKYIGKEKIEIKKLDTVFGSFCSNQNKIMLKIDTQGFEMNVLQGAKNSLKSVILVQLEMSLFPLYNGEVLLKEMLNYLDKEGFTLISLENNDFSDSKTGKLLQVDGIFLNNNYI